MTKRPSLEVDLANPAAVNDKLREINAAISEARAELKRHVKAVQDEIKELERYRQALSVVVDGGRGSAAGTMLGRAASIAGAAALTLSTASQVEAIVNELRGPVTSADALARLPDGTKRETVNWALWKAEQDGRIKKLSQGVYASLDYEPPQLVAAVDCNEPRVALSRPSGSGEGAG